MLCSGRWNTAYISDKIIVDEYFIRNMLADGGGSELTWVRFTEHIISLLDHSIYSTAYLIQIP